MDKTKDLKQLINQKYENSPDEVSLEEVVKSHHEIDRGQEIVNEARAERRMRCFIVYGSLLFFYGAFITGTTILWHYGKGNLPLLKDQIGWVGGAMIVDITGAIVYTWKAISNKLFKND